MCLAGEPLPFALAQAEIRTMKKTFAALAAFVLAVAVCDGMISAAQPAEPPEAAHEQRMLLEHEQIVQQGLRALVDPQSRVEAALAAAEGR